MCLAVWLGTAQPVTPTARPADASGHPRTFPIEEVPAGAAIRAHFASPYVTYVGSHQGCGCGFNSDEMRDCEGIATLAEAIPLLEALDDKTREEFLAEQSARVWLYTLVTRALADGDVELYGCWYGDEEQLPARVEEVNSRWLTELVAPVEQLVKYLIRAPQ